MTSNKIPPKTLWSWFLMSFLSDFWGAWFLMMGVGALGHSWGYWHAWWVIFCFGTALVTVLSGFTRILMYIGERLS